MHKKLKIQKTIIGVLAIIIALIVITVAFGRMQTVEIYVVKSKIDLSKPILDQKNKLERVKISKTDYKKLGEKIVSDEAELKNKHLQYSLEKGSPIPLSLLNDSMAAGQYAVQLDKNHTIFKVVEGISKLPEGVVKGDKVNIALTTTVKYDPFEWELNQKLEKGIIKEEEYEELLERKKNEEREIIEASLNSEKEYNIGQKSDEEKEEEIEILATGMLMKNVVVYGMTETDVLLKVTEQQSLILSNAQEIGRFVIQLPGQKETKKCTSKTKENCAEDSQKGTKIDEEKIYNEIKRNIIEKKQADKKDNEGSKKEKNEEEKEEETNLFDLGE